MSEPRPPRRPRRTVRAAVAGLLMTAVFATAVPVASAYFADSVTDGHTVSSASLQPATNPGSTRGTCLLVVGDAVVVSWTKTTSTWADGYEILRSTTRGGPYSLAGTATGQGTQSYTDAPLAFSTTYYYVVRATKQNWRSAATTEVSRTTRTTLCT